MTEPDEQFEIQIGDGSSEMPCVIRYWEDGEAYVAEFEAGALGTFRVSESDMFNALCRFREKLETRGLRPLCNGARLNCFPSGMARSMGPALKVYELEIGLQARRLVHALDPATFELTATVSDQRQFFDTWIASLQQQNRD